MIGVNKTSSVQSLRLRQRSKLTLKENCRSGVMSKTTVRGMNLWNARPWFDLVCKWGVRIGEQEMKVIVGGKDLRYRHKSVLGPYVSVYQYPDIKFF